MVKLKYTGLHLPAEIIDVDEKIANGLIKNGEYARVDVITRTKKKEKTKKYE